MITRNRIRQAVTTPALVGCLVAAVTLPPTEAQAAVPAAPVLPAYTVDRGTHFAVDAVLPVRGYHLTGRFGDVSGL